MYKLTFIKVTKVETVLVLSSFLIIDVGEYFRLFMLAELI